MNFCSGMCDAAIIEESGLPEPVRSADESEARRHLCERAMTSLSARGSEVAAPCPRRSIARRGTDGLSLYTHFGPGLGAAHAVCMRTLAACDLVTGTSIPFSMRGQKLPNPVLIVKISLDFTTAGLH